MATYYNEANMEVLDHDKESATIQVTKFKDMPQALELGSIGWTKAAFEMSGRKNFQTHAHNSISNGSSHTDNRITWKN